jgi:putative transposase
MIVPESGLLSIRKQCHLLGLNRSIHYYIPCEGTELNLKIMRLIDEKHLERPFYGSRRMMHWLIGLGYEVNRKRVQRLMALLCIEGLMPKPRTTIPSVKRYKYPYLLRNICIDHVNHVWGTDITYIPLNNGFVYLVAVLDWFSRYILSWRLSTNLESEFCREALEEALEKGKPEIFNTDQGTQFTCGNFIEALTKQDIKISMDGKGRALDNIYVERLWRSIKYEEVYLKSYEDTKAAQKELKNYLQFYNDERPHQSLKYSTPKEVFLGRKFIPGNEIIMK